MKALKKYMILVHDFITRPMYIDDSTIGCTLTIIASVGIIGWIIIGYNISIGWIVAVGWIILVGCYFECSIMWINMVLY